jgi:hypothetical protein
VEESRKLYDNLPIADLLLKLELWLQFVLCNANVLSPMRSFFVLSRSTRLSVLTPIRTLEGSEVP